MFILRKQRWHARFIEPHSSSLAESGAEGEIRWDPLLGFTVRITVRRRGQWDDPPTLPDITPQISDRSTCPFCEPRFSSVVPGFSPSFCSTLHICRGDAVCAPNRYPYGVHSAVVIFSKHMHYIATGDFTNEHYDQAFEAAVSYLGQVLTTDPAAAYQAITQNHLPSSGGSLIHPHLQINASAVPTTYHARMEAALRSYANSTGRTYMQDLIGLERDSARYLAEFERTFWMVPFAPAGQREVLGIVKSEFSLHRLAPGAWREITEGIRAVQRYYRTLGINSFNIAIYEFPQPQSYAPVTIRMIARNNYQPYPRNDMTYRETMLWEPSIEYYPEDMATALHPYFFC